MNITKNTISNKWVKKAFGLVLTLVIASTIGVNSAQALTLSDVELLISLGIIPAEKTAVARAAVGGVSNTSCGTFTRNLTLGSTGADVVSLQTFLESRNFLTMPVGVSKGYFGGLTQGSLARYQASVGIVPAVGYFGPITRSNIQNACVPVTPNPTPNNPDLGGDEASLEDYDTTSEYSNEDLEEGETAKVFQAEFTVEDGDVRIERIDVRVEAVSETNEDEPWKQLEEIAVYINGDKVADMQVDDEDEWSRESRGVYEVRFSDIDTVIEEGEDVEIDIEVTASDSIDDSDLDQSWRIWIPTDGIRAIDGAGIDQYTGSNNESKNFTIEAADDGDVTVRESDDDLESTILIVDNNNKKGPYEVFRFEIDNDDSADILVNTLTILATSSVEASNIDNVISNLTIEIDGEEFDFDSKSTVDGTVAYLFDLEDNRDEFPIEKGETVEVIVTAEFQKLSGNYVDGTTVQFGIGKINGENFDIGVVAEGESTGDDSEVSGRQEGAEHTLRTSGIVIEGVSEDFKTRENLDNTLEDNQGIFTFEVEITALEEDAYIPNSATITPSSVTEGFVTRVTGATYNGITSSRIADTTANTEVNGRYKIPAGTSDTFTIIVELDPEAADAYGLELTKVMFSSSSDGDLTSYTVPSTKEFSIPTQTIQN